MRFFFYGTLMDRDVLMRVLGRRIIAAALRPATLRGWRRMSIAGASYPIVVRDKAAHVEGMTFDGITAVEADRLSAYEGPRYGLVRAFADVPGHGPRAVFLFQPRPGAFKPIARDWSLAAWQAEHKAAFLAALGRDGTGGAASADRR